MAAVSIPPSPHAIGGVMSSHRLALAENPNLGNAPYPRPNVTPIKRARPCSNVEENTPPNKRQILEDRAAPKTPTRKVPLPRVEKKTVGDNHVATRNTKHDRGDGDTQSTESILQWQRHYRKIFPSYVFYFENIPEESRRRCLKGIDALGAREVKFFSKDVTHVITTRSMPSDGAINRNADAVTRAVNVAQQENLQPGTINPLLLERSVEYAAGIPKSKFNFDLASVRKASTPLVELNNLRAPVAKVDILIKAKELGIKIWQLEKLWRILKTIFDTSQSAEGNATRHQIVAPAKTTKQVDLSQMIKNEQIHERGDREINAGAAELIKLSAPYIYVRDMNEKTKPILVREYPKVDRKEDGEWPQFRSASTGKCPFVEEGPNERRMQEHREEKARRTAQARLKVQEPAQAKMTRTAMQPPLIGAMKAAPIAPMTGTNTTRQNYQLPPPPAENHSTFTNGKDGRTYMSGVRLIGGEPIASGLQQSNITSAIRSQMISSTAAAPGAKAGTSKEIHDLQRKALERNTHGLRPSQRMTDIAGQYGRGVGASTRVVRESAAIIEEQEDDPIKAKIVAQSKSRSRAKEDRTGYCENCRDKYADFDEHVQSRKHKKFATDPTNWQELDQLLRKLTRPLKSDLYNTHDIHERSNTNTIERTLEAL